MAKLHVKLARIVYRHNQLKLTFTHLKSQIADGFFEVFHFQKLANSTNKYLYLFTFFVFVIFQTKDVFDALAGKLITLVDLKRIQMDEEGRLSTIFMNINVCMPIHI